MDTQDLNSLSFRIRRDDIAKAQALAATYGVEIAVEDLNVERLAQSLFEAQTGHIAPSYVNLPEAYQRWAERLNESHCRIVAHAPVSDWAVIAIADRSDGATMFHSIDPMSAYWTTETMDGIDFGRCDECGVRNHRNRAFIIRKGDVIRQIGGACAKHLDLTKKVRDLLDGFQSFADEMSAGDDWGGGCCGTSEGLNVPLAMLLAEEMISFEGYVSKKVEWRQSTSDSVGQMMYARGKECEKIRDNDQWRNAVRRWDAGESEAVMVEVQAWLASCPDDQFHRNIATAIRNETHLGLICFAVAEIRNWRLAIKAKENEVPPKCYQHVDMAPEAIAEACGVTLQELGEMVGHDCSGKLKAPARKALAKVLPGAWTLIGRASWETIYGWQDMVQFQREDGSRVKWITGSLDSEITWQKGDKYMILSASIGDDLGTHEKYGVQGRKISRATIVPVKGGAK